MILNTDSRCQQVRGHMSARALDEPEHRQQVAAVDLTLNWDRDLSPGRKAASVSKDHALQDWACVSQAGNWDGFWARIMGCNARCQGTCMASPSLHWL